jgi:hypothetical protein
MSAEETNLGKNWSKWHAYTQGVIRSVITIENVIIPCFGIHECLFLGFLGELVPGAR